MSACLFKLWYSKRNDNGVAFWSNLKLNLSAVDWSPALSLLFPPYKEKELRRQQAEILKHQVGIPNNFFCHLNVLVVLKAFSDFTRIWMCWCVWVYLCIYVWDISNVINYQMAFYLNSWLYLFIKPSAYWFLDIISVP